MVDNADLRYPKLKPRLFWLTVAVFKFLVRLLTRSHIIGKENVPLEGPVIYASNHLHHLDTALIGASLVREGYVLAAEKYQGHIFEPILRIGGAIFINRGEADRRALRQALNVLEDGYAIGVALEGTRSVTGALAEGKTGAAYLATRTGATIVPLAVWGTEQIIPAWRRLRRADVYLQYGEPFQLPEGRARSAELETYTEQMMVSLARLLPPEYRGVYADHPLVSKPSSGT